MRMQRAWMLLLGAVLTGCADNPGSGVAEAKPEDAASESESGENTGEDARQQFPAGEDFDSKVESLRVAIDDLIQTFGERYPDGPAYLERLESADEESFSELQREALLANPLVSGQPLLYVVRAPDTDGTHHYIEPFAFQEEGAALKVIDLPAGKAKTIAETAEGIIRNPCVHFDGRRILFAMSQTRNENFNIFEADLDAAGEGIKQLTHMSDVSDVDPIYMADDSIVFSSNRDLKFVPCDLQIVPQLFRMAPDGANVHQITRSTALENQVSLMPDGRILYSRWDYVDRNFGSLPIRGRFGDCRQTNSK